MIGIIKVTLMLAALVAAVAVIGVARDVPAGQAITESDLREVSLSGGDGLATIAVADAEQVVGRTAAVALSKGALLTDAQLADAAALPEGSVIAGAVLTPGQYPVGLAVGELGVARARQSAERRSHLRSMRSLESIGALVSAGADTEHVWSEVRDALVRSLGLESAQFEAGDGGVARSLPQIERDGRVEQQDRHYVGDGFALPSAGAVLAVEADGVVLGRRAPASLSFGAHS